jgi:hypothetical protein
MVMENKSNKLNNDVEKKREINYNVLAKKDGAT